MSFCYRAGIPASAREVETRTQRRMRRHREIRHLCSVLCHGGPTVSKRTLLIMRPLPKAAAEVQQSKWNSLAPAFRLPDQVNAARISERVASEHSYNRCDPQVQCIKTDSSHKKVLPEDQGFFGDVHKCLSASERRKPCENGPSANETRSTAHLITVSFGKLLTLAKLHLFSSRQQFTEKTGNLSFLEFPTSTRLCGCTLRIHPMNGCPMPKIVSNRFVCLLAGSLTWFANAAALTSEATEVAALSEALRTISEDDLRAHVEVLADDSLEGREAGSRGGHAAAKYLALLFKKYDLNPAGDEGSYYQAFGKGYRNILGVLPGSDTGLQEEFIVVGAH